MNISSSGVLNIVAATYGLKDVTAQVAALVNRNAAPQTLSVAANNATFTDTWPNHAKVLTVVYRYDDGATRTVAAKEGATLSVGRPSSRRPTRRQAISPPPGPCSRSGARATVRWM